MRREDEVRESWERDESDRAGGRVMREGETLHI